MLDTIAHGDILELKLARPPVNALNPALIAALRKAIVEAPQQGARALILSAGPGLFSAGLDVPSLLTLDRDSLRETWRNFFGVMQALAQSPIPSVAAITGHSPAGGAVIALFADYRVMADGPYKIGLNETQVGLAIPYTIIGALARLIGAHQAERHVVAGNMIDANQARALGLVDELVPVEQVVERALAWCRFHLGLPGRAMLANRAVARRSLSQLFDDPKSLDLEGFVDSWFHPDTQAVLQALVAKLKGKG